MKKALFVCGVLMIFCDISVSHAFTVTRVRDVIFDIRVGELISGGGVQSIDVPGVVVNASRTIQALDINTDINPFSSNINRTPAQTVFRANFTNNEVSCDTAIDIRTDVMDVGSNLNRLSNPDDLSKWIGISYTLKERNRRCRDNGSLRRVNYRGDLQINDLNNAGSAETFRGIITLTVIVL